MNIAIVLVHNKTDQENEAQIEALKPLIQINDQVDPVFDENGVETGTQTTHYYTLSGLQFEHRAKFYQVFPFGVTPPPNYNDIDSYKVYYGAGDEDKTGDHPRFFNWGLKRATDYGADIVINLDNYTKFDITTLIPDIEKLDSKTDPTEFIDKSEVKIGTLKLLQEVGQLDETKTKDDALLELKEKITDAGLEVSEVKGG